MLVESYEMLHRDEAHDLGLWHALLMPRPEANVSNQLLPQSLL